MKERLFVEIDSIIDNSLNDIEPHSVFDVHTNNHLEAVYLRNAARDRYAHNSCSKNIGCISLWVHSHRFDFIIDKNIKTGEFKCEKTW
jgi:hypothetical protein